MRVLDKLKSLLGIESTSTRRPRGNVGVTVEQAGDGGAASTDGGGGAATASAAAGSPAAAGEGDAAEADEPADPQTTDTTESTDLGTDESPDVIKGIGPSYADRLANAGIETVAHLAAADVEALAAETDLSEKRVERWVGRARNR